MSDVLRYRGQCAALSRSRRPDDPVYVDARRNLAAAKLEAYISSVVAEAPVLTDDQVDRLTAAMRRRVSA